MVKANPRRREDGSRYAEPPLTHEEIQNFDGCNQSAANYQRNNFLIWEEPGPSLKEELLKELNLQFLCPPMLDELIRSHEPREIHEVTEEYVQLKGEKVFHLGAGYYGSAVKTTLGGPGICFQVAVKSARAFSSSFFCSVDKVNSCRLLNREGELMASIDPHVNIVELIAFLRDREGRRHLVLEYCSLGSLQTILPRLKVEDKTSEFLPEMCFHRDLALRNVLVTETFLVKIADFGLAKQSIEEASCKSYISTKKPFETAPEALQERNFSEKSDVYSFGLLLIFLFKLSQADQDEIIELASRNPLAIKKPVHANDSIFEKIQSCLNKPETRPTFLELLEFFRSRVPSQFLKSLEEQMARNQLNLKSILDFLRSIQFSTTNA